LDSLFEKQTAFLAFYCSLCQTANDLILQEEIDEHDWQGANQGASSKDAPLFVKLTRGEDLQTDHQRVLRTVVEQHAGE